MKKLAFFDTKPYDRESFDRLNAGRYDIRYFETRLTAALRDGTVGNVGLDVYEEESEWFYLDRSDATRRNKTLALLVSMPNVIVTSHQAFLTHEALANIASTTLANLDAYFSGAPLENEICYRCTGAERPAGAACPRRTGGRCK